MAKKIGDENFLWPRVRFTGDNQAVVQQCNGEWQDKSQRGYVSSILDQVGELGSVFGVWPRRGEKYFAHVKRKHNKAADCFAN